MKYILLTLILLSIVKRLISCNMTIETYNALYSFYNSTNGKNWTTTCNSNWTFTSNSQPCVDEWNGITCNNECQIIEISLSNCNLQGFLPTELGYLENMRQLLLQGIYCNIIIV